MKPRLRSRILIFSYLCLAVYSGAILNYWRNVSWESSPIINPASVFMWFYGLLSLVAFVDLFSKDRLAATSPDLRLRLWQQKLVHGAAMILPLPLIALAAYLSLASFLWQNEDARFWNCYKTVLDLGHRAGLTSSSQTAFVEAARHAWGKGYYQAARKFCRLAISCEDLQSLSSKFGGNPNYKCSNPEVITVRSKESHGVRIIEYSELRDRLEKYSAKYGASKLHAEFPQFQRWMPDVSVRSFAEDIVFVVDSREYTRLNEACGYSGVSKVALAEQGQPSAAGRFARLGNLYWKTGNYVEAMKCFSQAHSLRGGKANDCFRFMGEPALLILRNPNLHFRETTNFVMIEHQHFRDALERYVHKFGQDKAIREFPMCAFWMPFAKGGNVHHPRRRTFDDNGIVVLDSDTYNKLLDNEADSCKLITHSEATDYVLERLVPVSSQHIDKLQKKALADFQALSAK